MSRVDNAACKVGDHQVAANRIGVDGTVEVAAAVEVVSQTEGEATAEVALDGQVRLLRVGIDEVLGLRIPEGLEASGRKCLGQVEVVLVEENANWEDSGI